MEVGEGPEISPIPQSQPEHEARAEIEPSILIIEDDLNLRTMSRRLLMAHGYSEILEAENVNDAQEKLKVEGSDEERRVDLLITDNHLAGSIDGSVYALSEFREKHPDATLVLVSGGSTEEEMEELEKEGFRACIRKSTTSAMEFLPIVKEVKDRLNQPQDNAV